MFDKTGLNNFVVNNIEAESRVAMLNNIVDNFEQHGQQNIVQSSFHPSGVIGIFPISSVVALEQYEIVLIGRLTVN